MNIDSVQEADDAGPGDQVPQPETSAETADIDMDV
eukprot:jgi/Hompol1/5517/HPOL_004501-RA